VLNASENYALTKLISMQAPYAVPPEKIPDFMGKLKISLKKTFPL
jgi:hypothetical protein